MTSAHGGSKLSEPSKRNMKTRKKTQSSFVSQFSSKVVLFIDSRQANGLHDNSVCLTPCARAALSPNASSLSKQVSLTTRPSASERTQACARADKFLPRADGAHNCAGEIVGLSDRLCGIARRGRFFTGIRSAPWPMSPLFATSFRVTALHDERSTPWLEGLF